MVFLLWHYLRLFLLLVMFVALALGAVALFDLYMTSIAGVSVNDPSYSHRPAGKPSELAIRAASSALVIVLCVVVRRLAYRKARS